MPHCNFTATLLKWYAEWGRDLPWRHTTDAYAIWLSEVILQQTRIAQGLDYWHRFMHRWPRVDDLAAATEDEVLRLWQGLCYYSRARNLHTAAQAIVAQGAFPCTIEGLRALKGVGDYTAAAVGAMAFGLQVAAVDGNVYRVFRGILVSTHPSTRPRPKKNSQLLPKLYCPRGKPAHSTKPSWILVQPAAPPSRLVARTAPCTALARHYTAIVLIACL